MTCSKIEHIHKISEIFTVFFIFQILHLPGRISEIFTVFFYFPDLKFTRKKKDKLSTLYNYSCFIWKNITNGVSKIWWGHVQSTPLIVKFVIKKNSGCLGRDHNMVVGFITNYAISAYHH